MSGDFAEQVSGVSALAEPARRELYLYVAAQPDAVSREEAASAVAMPLHSAKFHLDRLVEEGLLDTEFRRLSGKSGPGAGRPAKLYRRSARQLAVSLPERHYELAGEVLASAIDRSVRESMPIADAVRQVAWAEGRRIAEAADDATTLTDIDVPALAGDEAVAGTLGQLERTADVLAGHGYEPRISEAELCLANCPFDRLAAQHKSLVCGMNLALIGGVIDELGMEEITAELDPQPGFCCVRVREAARGRTAR